jgi:hypothetical protein
MLKIIIKTDHETIRAEIEVNTSSECVGISSQFLLIILNGIQSSESRGIKGGSGT